MIGHMIDAPILPPITIFLDLVSFIRKEHEIGITKFKEDAYRTLTMMSMDYTFIGLKTPNTLIQRLFRNEEDYPVVSRVEIQKIEDWNKWVRFTNSFLVVYGEPSDRVKQYISHDRLCRFSTDKYFMNDFVSKFYRDERVKKIDRIDKREVY